MNVLSKHPTFSFSHRVQNSVLYICVSSVYLGWNRSPAQAGCMRQVLGPGALGRPKGIGWRGRWEGGSGWGSHVNPWLIHVNVWQKPLQYCKVISLQLIKINEKKMNVAHSENNLNFKMRKNNNLFWILYTTKFLGQIALLKEIPSCFPFL